AILKCIGAIRKASKGKQGFEKDVLKIAEIDNVLMYIAMATGNPKQDIPQ
ncbi:hypothetical protein AAVH_13739, partial [Aphelenchoides avenae]